MINEVCNKLREKRKELGYSIEQVVEKTKLYPSVIKDIESCNLGNVSATYLKGFIKIYASFLGVDLGTALEELPLAKAPKRIERKVKKKDGDNFLNKAVSLAKKISPQTKKKIIIVLAAIIALWCIFAVGKFTIRKISQALQRRSERVSAKKLNTEKISSPNVSDAGTDKKEEPKAGAAQSREVVASLTAKRKCFLRVLSDGKLLFEGTLDRGAVETWKANKELEFKISDGSAVYIEVNGKSIPTLTSIRKPIKSLKINSSGITVDK